MSCPVHSKKSFVRQHHCLSANGAECLDVLSVENKTMQVFVCFREHGLSLSILGHILHADVLPKEALCVILFDKNTVPPITTRNSSLVCVCLAVFEINNILHADPYGVQGLMCGSVLRSHQCSPGKLATPTLCVYNLVKCFVSHRWRRLWARTCV